MPACGASSDLVVLELEEHSVVLVVAQSVVNLSTSMCPRLSAIHNYVVV